MRVTPRYAFQYWTIILVLNLIAAFKGEGLDKILFVDGLIVAVFGTAAKSRASGRIGFVEIQTDPVP